MLNINYDKLLFFASGNRKVAIRKRLVVAERK